MLPVKIQAAKSMQIMTATIETEPKQTFALMVNYGHSLGQMIAAGRYDQINDGITIKKFPIKGTGAAEFEAKLFHFDREITSKRAKRLIEEAGYEPAKIEHFLAFGAAYPDEQRKYSIIGLGSVGKGVGGYRVPYLDGNGSERDLSLRWWGGGWPSDFRFLAVRKKSQTFALTVDCGFGLKAMVAAGRYDWINDNITVKRFPVKGDGVAEFETKLFQFDGISSKNAIKEIEAQGWQAAGIEHLLAFGAKNPDEQRKYPVVALGSVGKVGGRRRVPFLDGDGSERSLFLGWWDGDWGSYCRFLAVRRLSRPSGA